MAWIARVAEASVSTFCNRHTSGAISHEGNEMSLEHVRHGSRYDFEQMLDFLEAHQRMVKSSSCKLPFHSCIDFDRVRY